MEQVTINVYSFDELSDNAKEKVLSKFSDINVDYDWWEFVYEDAKNVGIKIKSFDLYRNEIEMDFVYSMDDIASKIMSDHGSECFTYKYSNGFLQKRSELVAKYSDGINTELVHEDNFDEFDEELDELEQDYMQALRCEYLSMLEKEYEYLTSSESIIETINCNEYQFTEDGEEYY